MTHCLIGSTTTPNLSWHVWLTGLIGLGGATTCWLQPCSPPPSSPAASYQQQDDAKAAGIRVGGGPSWCLLVVYHTRAGCCTCARVELVFKWVHGLVKAWQLKKGQGRLLRLISSCNIGLSFMRSLFTLANVLLPGCQVRRRFFYLRSWANPDVWELLCNSCHVLAFSLVACSVLKQF